MTAITLLVISTPRLDPQLQCNKITVFHDWNKWDPDVAKSFKRGWKSRSFLMRVGYTGLLFHGTVQLKQGDRIQLFNQAVGYVVDSYISNGYFSFN